MLNPGSKDIKVFLKFTEEELEILKDNTYQMAESFGLNRRIDNLTGKRKVALYKRHLQASRLSGTKAAQADSKPMLWQRVCKASPREEMRSIHEHL